MNRKDSLSYDGIVHFSVHMYGGKDDNGNKYAELLTHSAEHNVIQFSCTQQNSQL